MIGRVLLHYRIDEEIGQGGMSVVYRGRDLRLGRDVAVKLLHPFLASKADCRARLTREARAVARLQHPYILQIFDYSGEHDPEKGIHHEEASTYDPERDVFLVTELVEGGTLKEFARDNNLEQTPEAAALVAWALAEALEHAHKQGVVHRDVKPENVMVRTDGGLKLMDFGIAQVADQKSLTVTGTLLGSPAHMAPECIEGKNSDERSDIFSLGTVLYWLATGRLPFEAQTPHALLKAIVDGDYTPPQHLVPKVSDELATLMDRCLAKDPDARFQSAAELREALAELLVSFDVEATSDGLSRLLSEPEETMRAMVKQVRRAALKRTEELLDQGHTARALSTLGRVLAESPDDPEAQALLDRSEADASGPRWRIWALVASVIAVLGMATAVATQVEALQQDGASADGKNAVATADEGEKKRPDPGSGMSILPDGPALATKPGNADLLKKRIAKKPEKAPIKKMIDAKMAAAKNRAAQKNAREVVIRVDPFADIFVDGDPVALSKKTALVKLAPGPHRITFSHRFAATVERDVIIPKTGAIPDIQVKLERTKPAALVIKANVDADVMVDGLYKGSALGSEKRAITIALPARTHSHEVEVFLKKDGHRPRSFKQRLVAGQTTTLQVVLEPVPDDEIPTRQPIVPGPEEKPGPQGVEKDVEGDAAKSPAPSPP
jgi:serine/threonine-protein kinase